MHSEVQFKVNYLMISSLTGSFNNFQGGASSTIDGFEQAEIHFSLDVNSVDTNLEARDKHLKSSDLFDVGSFPHITFQSTSFKKVKGSLYHLFGLLTIKGITKPVELEAEYGGLVTDPEGNIRAGFEVSGSISRWEFGLTFNPRTPTGSLLLSEEVRLVANIQLVQCKAEYAVKASVAENLSSNRIN